MSDHQKLVLEPKTAEEWFESAALVFKTKKYDIAMNLIAKAIHLDPTESKYHSFLGIIFRKLNKNIEAEAAYKRALELNPENIEALHNLGGFYIEMGQALKSEVHLKKVIELKPDYYHSINALGLVHLQVGSYKKASKLFRKTLEVKPDFTKAFISLGELHQALHQPRKALNWYNKYTKVEEENTDINLKKAKCFLALGNLERCEKFCQKILKSEPNHVTANAVLGQCLEQQGEYQKAHEAFQKFKEEESKQSAKYHYSLSKIHFEQTKDLRKARDHINKALVLSPNYVAALLQHAHLDIIEGHLNRAETSLNKVLKISPEHPYALRQLAHIKKTDAFDQLSIDELEEKLKNAGHDEHLQNDLRFALADHLDQKQEHTRAFEHLTHANENTAKKNIFNLEHTKEQVRATIEYFTKEKVEELSEYGNPSECPVFIVGMPRSGTTLTEQILSSHPSIFGAGELPEMSRIKFRLQNNNTKTNFPFSIDELLKEQFSNIADGHIEYLMQLSPESSRVIDKMPFNFYLVGMIMSLFPNAKIIHSLRHPLDTCLSCYFLKFSDRLAFTYDLNNLGEVYKIHLELMEHWKEMFPTQIYTQPYEDLVENTEEQTKKLLEFIDLDWHENCLMHHENERPVKTASNWQVRQPIYKTSVGRWKNYREQLKPISEILELDLY